MRTAVFSSAKKARPILCSSNVFGRAKKFPTSCCIYISYLRNIFICNSILEMSHFNFLQHYNRVKGYTQSEASLPFKPSLPSIPSLETTSTPIVESQVKN